MAKYIIKRLLWMIPILLGVIFIVFTIEYLSPGDPVANILGSNYTEEQYLIKQAQMGLDQPYIVQLFNYIKGIVLHFDLGTSWTTKRSVAVMIGERFKPTFIIGVCSVIASSAIAIPLGVRSAKKQGTAFDMTILSGTVVLAAIPGYLLAILLLLLFCLRLKILPASGIESWTGYILPIVCSMLGPLVQTLRMTRSSMLDNIRSDFVRTARAKGLPESKVLRKHALQNALIPVLTTLGQHLGGALAGSIIVETIFTIPGLGMLTKTAISNYDFPVTQGCVLILSFIVCCMNLLTDIAYAAVDPRVYEQYTGGNRKKKNKNMKSTPVAVTAEGGQENV